MNNLPELDEIEDTLGFLDGWEDRFEYIIDLGKKLPAVSEDVQSETNRVHGCQSSVWMVARVDDGGTFEVEATSDAFVVNGLITILLAASQDKTARDVLAFDYEELFTRLGLEEHLSPTRRNGLHAMIERIRTLAKVASSGGSLC